MKQVDVTFEIEIRAYRMNDKGGAEEGLSTRTVTIPGSFRDIEAYELMKANRKLRRSADRAGLWCFAGGFMFAVTCVFMILSMMEI